MDLEYEISKDDVVEFRMNISQNSKRLQHSFFFKRFGLATIFLVTPFVINIFRGDLSRIVYPLFTIPFFLWIAFFPVYHNKKFRKFFSNNTMKNKKYKDLIGKQSLTINSKNIVNVRETGETKTRWTRVHKIDNTKDYAFIYTSDSEGIIIPARAFEDKASFKEFVATSKKDYKEATRK